MYKSNYPTYLVHFNKNHDPKNGQFTFGDGDGDGKIRERFEQIGKENNLSRKEIDKAYKDYKNTAKKVGSSETISKYDKYVYNANTRKSTIGNNRKNRKDILAYSKSAKKDEKQARKFGDEKSANIINATRMYLLAYEPATQDFLGKYINEGLDQLQKEYRIDPNKSLDYLVEIDEKNGGLTVSFPNYSNKKYIIVD